MITAEYLERHLLAAPPANREERRRAARSHAQQAIRAIGDRMNLTSVGTMAKDVPSWLRLGALDALAAYIEGRGKTCRHQPVPDTTVMAAAWRPEVVVCLRCTRHLAVDDEAAATRCDGCGHECAGLPDDPIWAGMLQVGALIYTYGACRSCAAEIPGTT